MSTDRCAHCGAVTPHGRIAGIQKVVAAYYDLAGWEMLSARRHRSTAWPRQVAMYLAREITGKSLPVIGRQFNRDHTTVIHAISAVEDRAERSSGQRADLEYLRGVLAR